MLEKLLKLPKNHRIEREDKTEMHSNHFLCTSDELTEFAKNIQSAIEDLERIKLSPVAWNLNIKGVLDKLNK